MLKFDIHPLLNLKGANKKLAYLCKRGFTYAKSHHLINKNVKTIAISDIDRLCLIFNCTPNELFSYEESKNNPLPENHALKQLVRSPLPSVSELVKDLSITQATDLINKLIEIKNQK